MKAKPKLVWIDLDNSPHVPFFRPIIDELRSNGCSLLLTARDAYQVSDLIRLYQIPCLSIGRHFGRNKLMKAVGLLVRTLQLLPVIIRNRPDLAVSHGSRAQTLAAKLLLVPSVVIADYEHVAHITRPDWMIVPEVIPAQVAVRFAAKVLTYPGIKEDVYAATFRPDSAILAELKVAVEDILVTVRPPATEAHYHNPESEGLLAATIDLLAQQPAARIVLLPRNARQEAELRSRWPELVRNRKIIIPDSALDGLNLVWHSDFVVSGGGTMNREAAALGVPVYSIFRGTIGAVDRYLASSGRMILLESTDDVRNKIAVVKRPKQTAVAGGNHSALSTIVKEILGVAGLKPALTPTS